MTRQREDGTGHDPVIVEMFRRIPAAGSVWPLSERCEWLQAMEAIINMAYGPADRIDIGLPMLRLTADQAAAAVETLTRRDPLAHVIVDRDEPSSDGQTDEAEMARDDDAASGSQAANTTEASIEAGMGSERSSPSETVPQKPKPGPKKKTVAPAAAPKSAPVRPGIIGFDFNGQEVHLDATDYVLAMKLKAAIGKHVDEAFLANSVYGQNTEATREKIRGAAVRIDSRVSEIGLSVEHFKGHGIIMKEVQ